MQSSGVVTFVILCPYIITHETTGCIAVKYPISNSFCTNKLHIYDETYDPETFLGSVRNHFSSPENWKKGIQV